MDIKSPRENEAILHAFVQQEDPHIAGMVGMHALAVLAGELPAEKFKEFLQESIQSAAQMKNAMMQDQDTGPNTPSAATNGGTNV